MAPVPAYAKPALNSMKILAATKKNSPEAKTASVIVGKRMRSLRRRNALWAGALALAAVGGVAAYKHHKGTLQLPTIPAGALNVVRSAANRASAAASSTLSSIAKSVKLGKANAPTKSLVQRGKNYMWPPTATAAPSFLSRLRLR